MIEKMTYNNDFRLRLNGYDRFLIDSNDRDCNISDTNVMIRLKFTYSHNLSAYFLSRLKYTLLTRLFSLFSFCLSHSLGGGYDFIF